MKRIFVAFVIAVGAVSAQADYLFWQVNTSAGSDVKKVTEEYNWTDAWDSARLVAVRDGVGTSTDPVILDTAYTLGENTARRTVDLDQLSNVGGASAYSYYIELVNSSYSQATDGVVYRSTTMTYAQLSSADCIAAATLEAVPQAAIWHGGTYTATPEPTSAMLMMFGAAALALRRKQRKLA